MPANFNEMKLGWCKELKDLTTIQVSKKNELFQYLNDKFLIGKENKNDETFSILYFVRRDIDKVLAIPSYINKMAPFSLSFLKNVKEIVFEENSKLEVIQDGCFAYSPIERIIVPRKTQKICKDAFIECSKLTAVEFLGDHLTFERASLCGCQKLLLVSFPRAIDISLGPSALCRVSNNFSLFICPLSKVTYDTSKF